VTAGWMFAVPVLVTGCWVPVACVEGLVAGVGVTVPASHADKTSMPKMAAVKIGVWIFICVG